MSEQPAADKTERLVTDERAAKLLWWFDTVVGHPLDAKDRDMVDLVYTRRVVMDALEREHATPRAYIHVGGSRCPICVLLAYLHGEKP